MYDVVIVGYGPTGQALAAMLGHRGYRVAAVERWPTLYPYPRAGHIDDEILRIFQALGIAREIHESSSRHRNFLYLDRRGEVLRTIPCEAGTQGWHSHYSLYQPQMERLLDSAVRRGPRAEIHQGWQAEAVERRGESVRVTIRLGEVQTGSWSPTTESRQLEARYVIGADGANSIVRRACGITMTDLGFEADWLVVFVERLDPSIGADMPDGAQLLDPARPTTLFRESGKRFARWEFMLMPGESREAMGSPEVCWRLIERWGFMPSNSRLIRHSVFTFSSAVAENWRAGRVLLAGDAAHLMPPFMGQGMCSGFRDALALTWKLDLVMRGDAPGGLLDTYMAERRPHVEAAIAGSVRVGQIVSLTDRDQADRRDALLRTGGGLPVWRMPGLEAGILNRSSDGRIIAPAGLLSIQGQVRDGEHAGLFDDIAGRGWMVIGTKVDPSAFIADRQRAFLSRIGAKVVQLNPAAVGAGMVDANGEYARWFDALGVAALIVRPDFYLFGGARTPEEIGPLIDDLSRQLKLLPERAIGT